MELVSKDSVIRILKKRTKAKAIKEIMALPSAGWHHGDPDESVAAIVERGPSYGYRFASDHFLPSEGRWECSDNDALRWMPVSEIIAIELLEEREYAAGRPEDIGVS